MCFFFLFCFGFFFPKLPLEDAKASARIAQWHLLRQNPGAAVQSLPPSASPRIAAATFLNSTRSLPSSLLCRTKGSCSFQAYWAMFVIYLVILPFGFLLNSVISAAAKLENES